jgi:hypothetical protein
MIVAAAQPEAPVRACRYLSRALRSGHRRGCAGPHRRALGRWACAIIAALLAAVMVKPRRQLLFPLWLSVGLSAAIYLLPPSIDGRGGFYLHVIVAVIVAILMPIVLVRRSSQHRSLAGLIAVSVAGVSIPPVLLLALLAAACASTTGECLG